MSAWERYKVDVPEGTRGKWKIERFTVEPDSPGRLHYMLQRHDVPPGTYTRLLNTEDRWNPVVMSDTPSEIYDHYGLFHHARGRVLIHGLGLGMALHGVLLSADVTHVDVVEIDPDVIALVAPHFQGDERVHVHQGDALTFRFPPGSRWDAVWHDIWPTICSDNLPEMRRLHHRYGGRCNWQGSWAREQLDY